MLSGGSIRPTVVKYIRENHTATSASVSVTLVLTTEGVLARISVAPKGFGTECGNMRVVSLEHPGPPIKDGIPPTGRFSQPPPSISGQEWSEEIRAYNEYLATMDKPNKTAASEDFDPDDFFSRFMDDQLRKVVIPTLLREVSRQVGGNALLA